MKYRQFHIKQVLARVDESWRGLLLASLRLLYRVKPLRPLVRAVQRPLYEHYRLTALVCAVVIVAGIAIPVASDYMRNKRYELNSQAEALLGKANPNLTKKLTYDANQQLYQFNKDAKPVSVPDGNPLGKLTSQIGGGGKNDKQLYSVDAPKDLSKGVTFYDNEKQLNFKVIPQFKTMAGEQRDGHLIYPLSGTNGQVAYTVDAGGLKENVVLYESPGATYQMSYKLDLPKSLDARLIPGTGEIGIYSADPTLFGQISYGSSDDQARVENARNNGAKTYLTFTIPAPQVMAVNQGGQAQVANVKSKFSLSGNILTVTTTGLDKAQYPLSIDPTVTIDSTSGFATGNIEDGNMTVSGSNLQLGADTGGSVGSWSTKTDNLTNGRYRHATMAYNGYLYVLGGDGAYSSAPTDVQYAQINSNGTLGTWQNTTSMTVGRKWLSAAIYNGYLYVLGGNDGTNDLNTVQYIKINSNGTLNSTWQTTSSFSTARFGHATVAYNGYMYVMGGQKSSASTSCRSSGSDISCDDTQYTKINADGTLGTWQSTTSLTSARYGLAVTSYNGYIYTVGGYTGSTELGNVQYARQNADGTISSWISTTSLTSNRYSSAVVAYNGYLYTIGGVGAFSAIRNYVEFAPINANGSIGAWQSTTVLPGGGNAPGAVAYNGYIYVVGGGNCCTELNTTYYAQIDPAGDTTGFTQTGTSSPYSTRYGHSTVVYNKYVYVMGGYTTAALNTVSYAPINDDGTLGTWGTTNSFTTARSNAAAFAYNGNMYIMGGWNGSTTYYSDVQKATINADGTLGTWSSTGQATLNVARYGSVAVQYNGYVYLLGGRKSASNSLCSSTSNQNCNIAQYGTINSSGNITAWTNGATFTNNRYQNNAAVYNGYLYLIGGTNGSSYYNDIQKASINNDGSVSSWSSAGTFTNGRSELGSVVYNGVLYILGGWNGSSYYNDCQYMKIGADGNVTASGTTPTFPSTRKNFGAFAYNGYLYITGGWNGSSRYNDTQFAKINNGSPGTTGSFAATTSFSNARSNHTSVVYNGYVYVIGGVNGMTFYNDVQYAPLNTDGTVGAWQTTSSFSNARSSYASVVYNGYLYILGGYNGSFLNDVQYAKINANGTLGAWSTTTSFSNVRANHTSVAYNGYLYVIGGNGGSFGPFYNDVQYAPLNTDGTVGTWQTTTSFDTNYRAGHTSVVYNGYVYVIGGSGSSRSNNVLYAPLNTDGTVGTWQTTTSLNTVRNNLSSFTYNGYLYILGGNDGTANRLNDVQYAPLNTDGTVGAWQTASSFTTGRQSSASIAYNGYLYVIGGTDGTNRLSDVQYATINTMPRKGTFSTVVNFGVKSRVNKFTITGSGSSAQLGSLSFRADPGDGSGFSDGAPKNATDLDVCDMTQIGTAVQIFITIDDTDAPVFFDPNTTGSQISSVTMDTVAVSAPTEQRLRHGAFFQNEQLVPLETKCRKG